MNHEPLPLIPPSEESTHPEPEPRTLELIGYFFLVSSWVIFVITVNTVFGLWKFVLAPFELVDKMKYERICQWLSSADYYVMAIWGVYVLAWWWALFSWVGLKLFRQSKGVQT